MIAGVKKYWFFIVVGLGVICLVFLLPYHSQQDELISISQAQKDVPSEEVDSKQITVIVDIKGEVHRPGVYDIHADARVNDVVTLAGGFTANADQFHVHLAQKVQDEMTIIVPKKGDEQSPRQDGSTKVRMNVATAEEIESLNGIGPAKAKAIIQYREEHGLFTSVEDLLNVSGIGEKTLENIKDEIQIP